MKKRYILIFFIILLTGIILRFYHIGAKSLWSDEAGSLITVHKDLKYLFTYLFNIDTHPPLYYLGLHLWIKIFGQTAAGLRSFSAVFSILTISLIFLLGKQFKDLTLGLILSFLFAISAYQVYFSQEARLYSLVMFIFCSGYYFYLRYFNYQKKTDLYLTALINLAGAYTFLYYIIILGLKDLFLLILMITGKIKKDFKHFIISRLVFIILYLPWIGIIIKKVNKLSGLSLQDNPMTGWTIPNVFIEYFAGIWKPDNLILYFLLPAVIIFSLVISLTRSRSNSPDKQSTIKPCLNIKIWFNFILLLAPLLGVIILPVKVHAFESKHLIFISLPLLIFLGLAISENRWKYSGFFITGFFILVNLCSYQVYYNKEFEKENWQQAADIIQENEKDTEIVFLNPGYGGYPFDYYYQGKLVRYGLTNESTQKEIKEAVRQASNVWLIESQGRLLRPYNKISTLLSESYHPILYKQLSGYCGIISIYRLNPVSE